jgi:hypothetical protein
MAALFSEIAGEATTMISRGSSKRPHAAPESATVAAPQPSDPANTISMSDLTAPQEDTAQPAPAEFAWPTTEQFSVDPPVIEEQPQFAQTILAPESAQSIPPTAKPVTATPTNDPFLAFAAEVSPIAPPAAAPVARQRAIAAPPVAPAVDNIPVAKPVARRNARSPMKLPLIVGGVGVLALVLAVGAYFAFIRHGSPGTSAEQDPNAKQSAKSSNQNKRKKQKSTADDDKIAEMRGDFTLGPAGKFRTIAAVLAELKSLKNNKSRNAVQIVKVAAGQTFTERLLIDDSYPRGIQFVAEPRPPPVLAPPGPEPIVAVRSTTGKTENFHLEGFRLDAAGKDIAVEVSDWTPGTQLKRLEIVGFGKTGVHFYGSQTYGKEDERIVLEGATFRDAAPSAVGVTISRKTEDSAFVRINQCRFFGPLECGVLLEANARGIEISESIFASAATGVKFVGEDRAWNDLLIGANTFYKNDRAIVFTNMPASRSRELQFHNNLFVDSKTADVVVEKDYKPAEFFTMYRSIPSGTGWNWTTRPASDPPDSNELATLFDTTNGKRGLGDPSFLSTDPNSSDFLAPSPNSVLRQSNSLLDPKRFGKQVGAVHPK